MGGGDLIVAVDGRPVDTFNDLIGYVVANRSPGETIVLSVLRDGRALDLSLTLEKRP
jgi:S1-C subfamily serine protease